MKSNFLTRKIGSKKKRREQFKKKQARLKKREKTRKKSNRQKEMREKVRQFKEEFGEIGELVEKKFDGGKKEVKEKTETLQTRGKEDIQVVVSFL